MLKNSFLVSIFLLLSISSFSQLNTNLLSNYVFPGSRGECSDIWGYVDQSGNEYAIVGNQTGVAIVDVTTPTSPSEVFYAPGTVNIWRDIKVWNNTAYITNEGSGGLMIIDMSNLPGPITGADVYSYSGTTYPFSTAHDFFVDSVGRGYVIGADNGVGGAIILDLVTNPLAPIELGRYNDFYLHDAMVRNDTLWGAAINNGFFVAVDVSNPAVPVTMASQITPNNFAHNCWISDNGRTLFTTDEVSGAFITSYDVSDLSNITELDRIQSSPGNNVIPHNTFFMNDYVITSYYRDGVVIHDVSSPSNMIEVGNYDTSPAMSGNGFNGVWGVYPWLPSGNIIASDIEKGLFVLGVNYTRAAYLIGNTTDAATTFSLNGVQVDIVTTTATTLSNAAGDYETGTLTAGTYDVTFSKFGYISQTINNVVLTNGATVTVDIALLPLGSITLSGQVVDDNLVPVPGAIVDISSTGFSTSLLTDGSGNFSIAGFIEGTYDVKVGKWGYKTNCVGNQTLNTAGNPYSYQILVGYADDFSQNLGWTVSGNPSTGDWVKGVPVGTTFGGNPANPGSDSPTDCSDEAYVTGNGGGSGGSDDIDGGETVLLSPIFDLTTYTNPYINYERWFFNDGGAGTPNDSLVVELYNGTTSVTLDIATSFSFDMGQWVSKNYRISTLITPTANMQLRIRAMDVSPGHISEGAFDNFFISDSSILSLESLNNGFEINVYPSPFSDKLYVSEIPSVENVKIQVIEISTGRLIDELEFENGYNIIFETNYSSGLYFVRIFSDNILLETKKIVKL